MAERLLTASRWKGDGVRFFTPHQWVLPESESWWRQLKQSHELPLLGLTRSEVTQTTPPACTPLPPDQDCLEHHPSGDRSVTLCVHLRAHKYAFMTNWQDRTVHTGTKRKGYKDLVKRSSEVSVFSVSQYLNWAPLPHSWPTPSWDGRLGRFGPVQTVLRPSRCLLHTPTPTPTFNTLSGSNYSKGGAEVRRRAFHIWKGEPGQTQFFYSFLTFGHCPGPALCLAHLLPLCNPGRAARGSWSSRNTLFSALTGTSKGNCSNVVCNWLGGWGDGDAKMIWDTEVTPIP